MRIVKKGATSQSVYFSILDSTSTAGAKKTGIAYNTSGLTAYYALSGGSATAITLATLAAANSAYSSGGFKEVDATNMPGLYRLDVPNAALTGADSVVISLKGVTGMVQVDIEIQLVAYDPQDAVRLGLTALPNAAAEAAGGLYTRGSGAGQINQPANGQIDANAVKVGGTSQTGRDLGASVLISSGTGTGQLDVTSGVIKANLAQILGTALTETAGQIAAGFKKFFNIATPASTMDALTLVATATTLTNAPSDSSGVTTLLSRLTSTRAGYLDNLSAGAVALASSLTSLAGKFTGITSLAEWLGLIAGKQTGNSTARTEIRATGAASGTFDETTDSLEAQKDSSADLRSFGIMNDTTIATLAGQTSFTLTAGSADNSAYLGAKVIITKSSNADQKAVGYISAYTGSTKTVTLLEDPAIFTMAVGDYVTILPPALEVFKRQVDGSVTFEKSVRLQNAVAGGKLSGAATTTVAIRDLADSKDRVSATVDANGNRSALTLDLT